MSASTDFLPDLLWFTTGQAGQFLGCSKQTIRRMIYRGELRVPDRRPYRIPRAELVRLAEEVPA